MMLNNNKPRKYKEIQFDNINNEDSDMNTMNSTKPVATKSRRALGDITNSIVNNEISNQNKDAVVKKAHVHHVSLPELDTLSVDQNDVMVPMTRSPSNESSNRLYMLREADDIDARDTENPNLCTCIVNEMYDWFGDVERSILSNTSYMATVQPHINERMRCILIDWLVEVHLKFKMATETLYLTVQIIDRFLEQKQVRRSKLQLVGVSALLLASKYEEIYPPELRDLVYITDRAYNKHEILEMETMIVTTLSYNLTVPTIHSFLCRFLKAAHADRTMVQLACYLAERSLQEYSMIKHFPSVIAATSVMVARKSLRRHPWSPTLMKYTKYDESDLALCANDMKEFMDATAASQQQAVHRKYTSPKYGSVARLPVTL